MADKKISELAAETTPADADLVAGVDIGGGITKKFTWTVLKAFLKTYFDGIYQAILVSGTNIKTIDSVTILGSGNIVTGGVPLVLYNELTSQYGGGADVSSDDYNYMINRGNNTNFIYVKGGPLHYQLRNVTTDYAASNSIRGAFILGQYLYVLLCDTDTTPDTMRLYRYNKDNLAAGGTQMTIAGAKVIPTNDYQVKMATDGTSFYFSFEAGNSANAWLLAKYSLSGTTITYVSTITCGSATLGFGQGFQVLASGDIYIYTYPAKVISKFNSSGTLQYTDTVAGISDGPLAKFVDTLYLAQNTASSSAGYLYAKASYT